MNKLSNEFEDKIVHVIIAAKLLDYKIDRNEDVDRLKYKIHVSNNPREDILIYISKDNPIIYVISKSGIKSFFDPSDKDLDSFINSIINEL